MTTIDPILKTIIDAAFLAFHALVPKAWQLEAVQHIIQSSIDRPSGPVPIMVCRPTGGGKSAVRDCAGIIIGGGVVLMIVPLLALAGNQTSKLEKAAEGEGNIKVFNLDQYKNNKKKNNYRNPCWRILTTTPV